MRTFRFFGILLLLLSAATRVGGADTTAVGFDSERWQIVSGAVVDHDGRRCLAGSAHIDNVAFLDGVLEVDLWVDGSPSYPGFVFRRVSPGNEEEVYVRPHRAGLYPDAVQYTPRFNGTAGWQLYNGDGYTAGVDLPRQQWVHLRLEVRGTQARLFVGDGDEPALEVYRLKREPSAGGIGVSGGRNRVAYFTNFSFTAEAELDFEPPPIEHTPPGIVTDWQLSSPAPVSRFRPDRLPTAEELGAMSWHSVEPEPSGLVNVARHLGRSGREPDTVFAKTTVRAEQAGVKKMVFGYSDRVSVFLNGQILFIGDSSYRLRDPSFLGVVGPFDALYLPLDEGANELVLMVTESFGGWGFLCQDGDASYYDTNLKPGWQTARQLAIPESVVFDRARGAIYVSNYDGYNPGSTDQFVSRLAPDGMIRELRWVDGLRNPTGMALTGSRLYVVERTGLAEVDPDSGDIVARHTVPQAGFLNDVAVDGVGRLYLSDSRRHIIFRLVNGRFEEWLSGGEIGSPNGLHVHNGELLVGNNADGRLKAVDLDTRRVRTVARLGEGIIDGIRSDGDGNLLVSHWQGRLYRVSPSGEVTKLLDTTPQDLPVADFEFVTDPGLLLVPTFFDNRVVAYQLDTR